MGLRSLSAKLCILERLINYPFYRTKLFLHVIPAKLCFLKRRTYSFCHILPRRATAAHCQTRSDNTIEQKSVPHQST